MTYDIINKIANNQKISSEEIRIIASGLKTKTLIGAIDGSEKRGNQVGGWTLYDTKQDKLISGSAPIPGHPLTANSTRPEQGIQISILHIILIAAQTHNIHSSKVKIYIDNISSFIHTTKHKR